MRRRALLLLAAGLFLLAAARDAFDAWIDATKLPPLALETSPEMRDRNGRLLRAFTVDNGRWRLATRLGDVDPDYIRMLIAYEDKRFYTHSGVDLLAFLRAAGQAIANGRIVSGGSTLSMQAARLLEESGTGSLGGKLRQIRVALALERRLSKDEILELYLNRAPFGGNLEGVRSASFAWFGKEPRRLTPAEAALLVALPQAPESRRPDLHHARALAARNRILERLASKGAISESSAQAAMNEPVPTRRRPFPALAPHLTTRLHLRHPDLTALSLTLDATLQRQLETLARMALRRKDPRLSIAILVADHGSGEILASVGSAAYRADTRQGFVDMTTALRSPGSTLKPLIYAMAFDEGIAHPETMIEDRPTSFGSYTPSNFDGRFRGTIRLRRALQLSLNIPAVKLLDAVGPARLVARLRRAGANPVLPNAGRPGLAVGLGGVGLSLEDLVRIYGSLANGGKIIRLHAYGAERGTAPEKRLVSPEAAWQIGNILSGLAPPAGAPAGSIAYKTGTSYGNRDAWAIGFDGRHVAGIWMGRADGTPVPGAFGADLAAPVLFEVFARLKTNPDPLPPPPPATLIATNGELPAPLRHFRPRGTLLEMQSQAPIISFPPDGAMLEAQGPVIVRVREGTAPYTWLVNGRPAIIASHEREAPLDLQAPGFFTLSVIDARGRSARTRISIR